MPDRIANIVNRLGRTIHALQFAEGLNPAQWEALRYLAKANRYSRTPTAIAEYLRTTKGTASQTLRSLAAKGLISKATDRTDRRVVLLDVTAAGHGVLARDPIRRLARSAECLGPDLERANGLLQRLAAGLEAAAGLKGFGLCADCTHFCKNAAAASDQGPHRCGLTGDGLATAEAGQICVNYARVPEPGSARVAAD
jgi:DNA-binding MarR family transcriptional regulator